MSTDQQTIQKADAEKIQKENEVLKTENSDMAQRLEKLEKSEKASRVEKDVSLFPSLNKEDVTKALAGALEVSDDHYEMIKKSFVSAEEITKASAKGAITKELGTNQESTSADPILKFAEDIRKADPSLTKEQAYTQALNENPDLYDA